MADEHTDWPDPRIDDLARSVLELGKANTEQHKDLGRKLDDLSTKVDTKHDALVESIATDKAGRAEKMRAYALGAGVPILLTLLGVFVKLAFG